MSKLETNTVDSISGTSTLTLGGSNASVVSAGTEVRSNKLSPASGTALQIGDSGDTITIPSGATIVNSGTQTGFGGTMTPAFQATAPGDQSYSDASTTVIPANNVSDDGNYNINSAYNTSTYRFTPQVAGKYFCYIQLTASNNAQNLKRALTSIRKNSTDHYQDFLMPDSSNYTYKMGVFQGLVLELNGSSDYFEATLYLDGTSGNLSTDYSRIGAYKIIE